MYLQQLVARAGAAEARRPLRLLALRLLRAIGSEVFRKLLGRLLRRELLVLRAEIGVSISLG